MELESGIIGGMFASPLPGPIQYQLRGSEILVENDEGFRLLTRKHVEVLGQHLRLARHRDHPNVRQIHRSSLAGEDCH